MWCSGRLHIHKTMIFEIAAHSETPSDEVVVWLAKRRRPLGHEIEFSRGRSVLYAHIYNRLSIHIIHSPQVSLPDKGFRLHNAV